MIANWLDIVLLIIVLITAILGIIKGFVRGIIGIAAAVAGLILASLYYPLPASFLFTFISSENWSKFIGFLIVFFAVLSVGWLIAFLLSKLMKGPLKFVDHLMGGILGCLKGIIICGVVVFALLLFPIERKSLTESSLAPECLKVTKALFTLVPRELKEQFKLAYEDIIGRPKRHGKKV